MASTGMTMPAARAERAIKAHPAGSRVTVKYDPAAPDDSVGGNPIAVSALATEAVTGHPLCQWVPVDVFYYRP